MVEHFAKSCTYSGDGGDQNRVKMKENIALYFNLFIKSVRKQRRFRSSILLCVCQLILDFTVATAHNTSVSPRLHSKVIDECFFLVTQKSNFAIILSRTVVASIFKWLQTTHRHISLFPYFEYQSQTVRGL